MKVGVDAVLLGAFANPDSADSILDIGTGTGLLSLMLAQKCEARIVAVEIDDGSYLQALENISGSRWSRKITVLHTSFQNFVRDCHDRFDFIICNPPFFNSSLVSSNAKRTLARHDQSLSLFDLFNGVDQVLCSTGHFAMIYPYEREVRALDEAAKFALSPLRIIEIKGNENKKPNRVIIEFSRIKGFCETSELVVRNARTNQYTENYKEITRDYYLK